MESDNPYRPSDESFPTGAASGIRHSTLTQIRIVSILLIVHGAMLLMMGVFLVGVAIALPIIAMSEIAEEAQDPDGPTPEQMKMILLGVYGGMGTAGLIPGVVQIVAGIANLRLKRRTLGIVALAFGLISMGTCYCTPTAIALCVYGLVIYLNQSAVQIFALGAQGKTFAEIEQMAR